MSEMKRQIMLAGLMTSMLAIAAGWIVMGMMDERAEAMRAAEDLTESRRLAGEIARLRAQPAVARAADLDARELGRMIEEATVASALERPVESFSTGAATRVGNSPYMRRPADIRVKGVSLPAFAAFLHQLTHEAGLTVSELSIRSPRGDEPGADWEAEATLTYLVYAPLEQRPGRNDD